MLDCLVVVDYIEGAGGEYISSVINSHPEFSDNVLLQKWFKGSTQARGQALYTTISYGLGGSIGGVAAGWVWEHLGPEHVFAMAAGACFISLLSIQRVIKRVHYIHV